MKILYPGATIGVFGGGQLARMLALEARRMGYRIVVLDPDSACPAAQVADGHVLGSMDDVDAAETLARQCDVVTLDNEHVPVEVLERAARFTPVRPSAAVLGVVQDRLEQRRFLERHDTAQVRYAAVDDLQSLHAAAATIGLPGVLKTRRFGYDGKGQVRIERAAEIPSAWDALGHAPAVLEAFADFDKEISVLLSRSLQGTIAFHPVAENLHRNHILWTSRVPARISAQIDADAKQIGRQIAEAFDYVGMLAIELFLMRDGSLLVNEIAPRTHNSGHFSLGACATSQFEQHVRAICGLALGDPSLLRPAVMLNILGDLWRNGPPSFSAVLSQPAAHLHLYGKKEAYPGRKMGHVVVSDNDAERAYELAVSLAAELDRDASDPTVR